MKQTIHFKTLQRFRLARLMLMALLTIWSHHQLRSQDNQFSQYYAAKFDIAPSFAGTTDGGRGMAIFRDQWPLMSNSYVTYAFALDHNLPRLGGGVGIFALQDYSNGGAYIVTNTGVQYTYALYLTPLWQFRPGIQLSRIHSEFDLDKIIFGSELSFDGINHQIVEGIESDYVTLYESAVSVLFSSDNAWIGAKIDHIPLSKNTFSGELYSKPVKFITFGGVCLKTIQGRLLYDQDYIYFSYLFKYQDKFKQLDIGTYWSNKTFELGLWYRGLPFFKGSFGEFNNSALILKAGIDFKNYRIGYSYDHSLSKVGAYTGGAHEVTTVVLFNQGRKIEKKKYKMVPGPKF